MYQQYFVHSPLLAFPLLALILFVAVFSAIVLRTLGKKWRETATIASRLPLEDDMPGLQPARMSSMRQEGKEGRHE
jgi:cbb3-type cytochrome oxidase subunit 3